MSDYLGHGWLVAAYLRWWQELARTLAAQVYPRVTEPYVLGDVR